MYHLLSRRLLVSAERPLSILYGRHLSATSVCAQSVSTGRLSSDDAGASSSRPLEPDVGITEFINKKQKFSGVLRERYSDFIVNELRSDGCVVRLTDMSTVPKLPQPEPATSAAENYQIPDGVQQDLERLVEEKIKSNRVEIPVAAGDSEDDKAERRALYHAIRKHWPDLACSFKRNGDGSAVVSVKYVANNAELVRFTGDTAYCKFVMYKENRTTIQALSIMAKALRLKHTSLFSVCGHKDKRSVSSQEVTASKFNAEKLAKLELNGIRLGNFEYTGKGLWLGANKGNHFTIVLRRFNGTEESLADGMQSLGETGFINYFGMQRFSGGAGTHLLGKELFCSRYSNAVDMILSSGHSGQSKYSTYRQKAYEVWKETGDAVAAGSHLRFACQESDLLNGLDWKGADKPREALGYLASNTLRLFFDAYRSYIWNRMASRRIREFGLQPMIGDLVVPQQWQSLQDGVMSYAGVEGDDSQMTDSDCVGKSKMPEVEYVTADNMSQFSIFDVVLPMCGKYSQYPANEVGTWYREALSEDGIDMDKFPSGHLFGSKFVFLSGAYRRILIKPSNVSSKLLHYNDVTEPLVATDLDRLQGKLEPHPIPANEAALHAARLDFSLPPGSYATMAVREVCQVETFFDFQKSTSAE